jgi:hypothetical protein
MAHTILEQRKLVLVVDGDETLYTNCTGKRETAKYGGIMLKVRTITLPLTVTDLGQVFHRRIVALLHVADG